MENNQTNNKQTTLLLTVVIVLLVIIAVLAFFVGRNMGGTNLTSNTNTIGEEVKVTVIDDSRCLDCQTTEIVASMKQIPKLAAAEFEMKDFSDEGVKEYMETNNIKALPAVIFSTANVDLSINKYLSPLSSGEYSLQIGSEYDPFTERSENGYLMINSVDLKTINDETVYTEGEGSTPWMWMEFTDIECPACQSFHERGIHKAVLDEYGDRIRFASKHFPLNSIHPRAKPAAEAAECVGEQLGNKGFAEYITNLFASKNLSASALLSSAEELGADKAKVEACLDSGKYGEVVDSVQNNAMSIFAVRATPTNIILNTETGEYVKLTSWDVAGTISSLLK